MVNRITVQFNLKKREVSLKIVYYGPPLSGKTTNLQMLFDRADSTSRGRLVTLETQDDRTIYFDMLPMILPSTSAHRLSVKLYTVPGQPMHNATRRVVLKNVDGVAFIATSERSLLESNREAWSNYRQNLQANNMDIHDVPTVIQFNKQDLPDVLSPDEIRSVQDYAGIPAFPASAMSGDGCVETVSGLLRLLWIHLSQRQSLDQRIGLSLTEYEVQIRRLFGTSAKPYG